MLGQEDPLEKGMAIHSSILAWEILWTKNCKIQAYIEVGKTTKPFRYDLNQIPYDYTMEVTNRFKGLDLIERVPEELWMEILSTV